jgi:hypothetical protein
MPEGKERLPPIEIPWRCEREGLNFVWTVQHIEKVASKGLPRGKTRVQNVRKPSADCRSA